MVKITCKNGKTLWKKIEEITFNNKYSDFEVIGIISNEKKLIGVIIEPSTKEA